MTSGNRIWLLVALGAALGLGRAAGQETVLGKTQAEWLQILREHKEPRFRRAALIALEAIGPQRGVLGGLYEALEKDGDAQVRREVVQVLARLGPDVKGVAPVVALALKNDTAGPVREAAATALGGKLLAQAGEHVPMLAAALKDQHAGTRAAAAEALKNLGEAARTALPGLIAVAGDRREEKHTRLYAIQALSRWGKDEASTTTVLVEVLSDAQTPVAVREASALGLGRLDCTAPLCVTALAQALGDKSAELRLAAATALTALGGGARDAWPGLRAAFKDADSGLRHQLIRAAGAMAAQQPEAIATLAEVAQNDEATENRLAAIQELGEAGPAARAAAPVLERLAAQEARARLREAAAAALKKIRG